MPTCSPSPARAGSSATASGHASRATALVWGAGAAESGDTAIVRPAAEPFAAEGGLKLLHGNLGRGVIKISAVKPQHRLIEAPAMIFTGQDELIAAFKAGELDRDLVAVVRFQGPQANGMPELHKLTPSLGVLQDKGFKVALVTDGRMSGASGKVPAAIHVTPEAADGGPLARLRDGDIVRLDAEAGTLEALVEPGRVGRAHAGDRRSLRQRPWHRPRAVRPPAARHRRCRDRRLPARRSRGLRRRR